MGLNCRCTDIDEYEADIETLNSILEEVKGLTSDDEEVTQNLKSVASVFNDAVLAPKDVNVLLWLLNRKTNNAIESMDSKVRAQISDINDKLWKARLEDIGWHILHPFG